MPKKFRDRVKPRFQTSRFSCSKIRSYASSTQLLVIYIVATLFLEVRLRAPVKALHAVWLGQILRTHCSRRFGLYKVA